MRYALTYRCMTYGALSRCLIRETLSLLLLGPGTQDASTGTIDIVSVRKRHISRAAGPVRYVAGVANGSAAQCCRGGGWSHRKYFDGYACVGRVESAHRPPVGRGVGESACPGAAPTAGGAGAGAARPRRARSAGGSNSGGCGTATVDAPDRSERCRAASSGGARPQCRWSCGRPDTSNAAYVMSTPASRERRQPSQSAPK